MKRLRKIFTSRELKYQIFNAMSRVLDEGVIRGKIHETLGTSKRPLITRILFHLLKALTSLKIQRRVFLNYNSLRMCIQR